MTLRRAAFVPLAAWAASCGRSPAPRPPAGEVVEAAAVVRDAARPITGAATDYDPLLTLVGDARVVFLGESTHGTHEYYRERARITRRLVEEKGFTAVAIEGDWPETHRVNEYVRGRGGDATPERALGGFTRFPTWMWGNADVRDLARWMRERNDARPDREDVGIYGLDVYALGTAIDEVERHLGSADPAAARRVRAHYDCFDRTGRDPQRYGPAAAGGRSCERDARAVLDTMRRRAEASPADPAAADALFSALRSAHSVANAEEYFRASHEGGTSTWNLRDRRMAEGLEALERHLERRTGRPAKLVVWAHNTHVGDARHTESGELGELNIGQLVRDRLGTGAVSVGFFTHRGSVLAAPSWGAAGRTYTLRPALRGSVSDVFHAATTPERRDFLVVLREAGRVTETFASPRLERAVGVIYSPRTERESHYFHARLSRQFDAAVFLDETSAVRPLGR